MRSLGHALILCGVAALCAAAEPYFPALAKGETWGYRVEQGSEGSDPKSALNGVEILGKNKSGQFLLAAFNPNLAADKQIMDIIRIVDEDVCVMDPFHGTLVRRGPQCEKLPKKGEAWRDSLKLGEHTMVSRIVFRGKEIISVGAGKFDALKFDCVSDYFDAKGRKLGAFKIDYWYAAEVKGLVKVDSRETKGSGKRFLRATLESYPARPAP